MPGDCRSCAARVRGAANVCFTRHAPERIRFECRHPRMLALGDVAAAAIKAATLGLVRERPGCGCARRRRKLNERFSWAVPNGLYRLWRTVGSRLPPRVAWTERGDAPDVVTRRGFARFGSSPGHPTRALRGARTIRGRRPWSSMVGSGSKRPSAWSSCCTASWICGLSSRKSCPPATRRSAACRISSARMTSVPRGPASKTRCGSKSRTSRSSSAISTVVMYGRLLTIDRLAGRPLSHKFAKRVAQRFVGEFAEGRVQLDALAAAGVRQEHLRVESRRVGALFF